MGALIRTSALVLLWFFISLDAGARPEKVKAGVPYYSDDFVEHEGIRDLSEEKNFEEVYQFYRYYEAIYDEAGRVTVFVEYVRGEMRKHEEYRYGPDGKLAERKPSPPD